MVGVRDRGWDFDRARVKVGVRVSVLEVSLKSEGYG